MGARELFLAAAACSAVFAADRTVDCPVIADNWISIPPIEAPDARKTDGIRNYGADTWLPVRGRESLALLQFDVSGLKGRVVRQAVLRIYRDADPVPLVIVGLSTISGNGLWAEGESNFFAARAGQQWSYPGSDITDVIFTQGGSLYTYERARDAGGGWYELDVPAPIVAALVSGDQFGIALTDEKGQTQTVHRIGSRESDHPPVLRASVSGAGGPAPGPVRARPVETSPEQARKLGRTTLRTGTVILHFGGAGDAKQPAAHYELRYSRRPVDESGFDSATPVARWMLNPLAPKSNVLATANALQDWVVAVVEGLEPGARFHFAARAVDAAGRTGPVSSLGVYRAFARALPSLPPPPAARSSSGAAGPEPGPIRVWAVPELLKIHPRTGELLEKDYHDHRARNSVWDASTAAVKLAGARNEFLGFQLSVESAAPVSGVEVSVSRPLFGRSRLPAVFERTGAVRLAREWFVPQDGEWYADALAPMKPLDIPAADNRVPGQHVAPVFVDVYVPHDAAPGAHSGELLVRAAGFEKRIRIDVEVLPFTLPDKLGFIVDLNSYSAVPAPPGITPGTPGYRALLHAYHRIAHLHRANLDVLGYSQRGGTEPDQAPPLEGEGARTRVVSWQDWDAHYGPILSGSAFRDLPRASVPVPVMYLPFFENWPGELRRDYPFEHPEEIRTMEEYSGLITRHAVTARPIEEMFTPDYQDRVSAVTAEFARHIRERGWLRTDYQFFLNNKYYFKRPPPEWPGNGSSLWLLDEPNHRDDFRALSFFFNLGRRGLANYPDVPIRLRADISRVEWTRDLLAGQLDITCVSSRLFNKNRYLMDDRTRFGSRFWNYASANHPKRTNVAMRAWCWRAWASGAEAVVPWLTTKGGGAWDRAEELTVFYPGDRFGSLEPFPSLRLKAFRRGQQDIEYLLLLAARKGWDRDAVAAAVLKELDFEGGISQSYDEDAGNVAFGRVKDNQMEELRRRVARALVN